MVFNGTFHNSSLISYITFIFLTEICIFINHDIFLITILNAELHSNYLVFQSCDYDLMKFIPETRRVH